MAVVIREVPTIAIGGLVIVVVVLGVVIVAVIFIAVRIVLAIVVVLTFDVVSVIGFDDCDAGRNSVIVVDGR